MQTHGSESGRVRRSSGAAAPPVVLYGAVALLAVALAIASFGASIGPPRGGAAGQVGGAPDSRTSVVLDSVVQPPPLTVTTTSLPSVQACASLFPCPSYSAPLSATGGTPGYTWSVVSGTLPAGLSLQANGVVVGYPIQTPAGTYPATFQVTDSTGATAEVGLSIQVTSSTAPSGPALTVTTTSLPSVQACASLVPCPSYAASLGATGGTPGYTWSVVSGTLPSGLSLQANGVLVGYPLQTPAGTYPATYRVTDSTGATAQVALSIQILPAPLTNGPSVGVAISSATNRFQSVGQSLGITFTVTNTGSTQLTGVAVTDTLKTAVTCASTGLASGTSTSCTSTYTVTLADVQAGTITDAATATALGPQAQSVQDTSPTSLVFTFNGPPLAPTGFTAALTGQPTSTGQSVALAWLPAVQATGYAIFEDSGEIAVTTSTSYTVANVRFGGHTFYVVATNANGTSPPSSSEFVNVVQPVNTPLAITTTSLPSVQACASLFPCTSYSAPLSAIGGTPGYTWSVASGTLPAGLSLQSNGVIVGYPIQTPTGSYSVTFQVTDAKGATASAVLTILVT